MAVLPVPRLLSCSKRRQSAVTSGTGSPWAIRSATLSERLLELSLRKDKHRSVECTCSSHRCQIAQSVTCLTADTCLSADSGVTSCIPAWFHTFVEIDHEMISTVILLPSSDLRRVVVSYTRKYVHEVLVN